MKYLMLTLMLLSMLVVGTTLAHSAEKPKKELPKKDIYNSSCKRIGIQKIKPYKLDKRSPFNPKWWRIVDFKRNPIASKPNKAIRTPRFREGNFN